MEDRRVGRARAHLANERTFLAWLRTGVALIALGLAAGQLLTRQVAQVPLARSMAVGLIASGIFLVLAGLRRYFRSAQQIDAGEFEPAVYSVIVATILIVLVGLMSAVFVLLLD